MRVQVCTKVSRNFKFEEIKRHAGSDVSCLVYEKLSRLKTWESIREQTDHRIKARYRRTVMFQCEGFWSVLFHSEVHHPCSLAPWNLISFWCQFFSCLKSSSICARTSLTWRWNNREGFNYRLCHPIVWFSSALSEEAKAVSTTCCWSIIVIDYKGLYSIQFTSSLSRNYCFYCIFT